MSAKYADGDVTVRPARREDMAAVAEMIQELADFEKMPEGPKLTIKDLERDCFDRQPCAFRCLVAEVRVVVGKGEAVEEAREARVSGYAVYFPTYSTWEGRALMLEDLYVRRAERRRGLGDKLFRAVAKEAARGGSRLDFHVLEWNEARAFYEARGAHNLTRSERWCYYRLAGDRLRALADRS